MVESGLQAPHGEVLRRRRDRGGHRPTSSSRTTTPPHTCGLPNWAPGELAEAVAAFDADGFQIHIHAIGDGGVRRPLDAIEHAGRVNGPRDRRPVIAHTQLVHPADRPRFAALGVIANFEPLWACLDPTAWSS